MYLPLDQLIQQSGSVKARTGNSTQELLDLAKQLAPYLPAPSNSSSVNSSRLNDRGRGGR
jgi:hypothetical protein